MEVAKGYALLCSRDPVVIEAVEVSAAAQDVELRVVRDAAQVDEAWAGAAVRLIGVEVAARWGSPGPGEAHLVGGSAADLARCSAELSLPVLALPDAQGRLAAVLTRAHQAQTSSRIVTILGAGGGLGVSTLTVSLAAEAARVGRRAVAVDLVASGGGLDLLMGIEAAKGLRWPDLRQARGELGDVFDALPEVGGARILSHGRPGQAPPEEAVRAVFGALSRSADVIVVDAGRGPVHPQTDRTLLVVGADVRSVAAAQSLGPGMRASGVVVRSGPGRRIPAEAVARSLGVECIGAVSTHKALPRLAELGLPPHPGPARRHARQVSAIWRWLSDA